MNLRYLTEFVFLFFAVAAMAQQQKMTIHLKDGQQITYDINSVDHVELQAPTSADSKPVLPGVGGVVGGGIDLGLSVQWADHNVGATYATDDGARLSWADADVCGSEWGEGWRLPTEAEWQELYNNCHWSWAVRDGVGGRLITAGNGNSIFIPATGVSLDGCIQIRGCIGIYWTAAELDPTEATPANAIGAYFDSANIYRIDYPRTNLFSVRLVK